MQLNNSSHLSNQIKSPAILVEKSIKTGFISTMKLRGCRSARKSKHRSFLFGMIKRQKSPPVHIPWHYSPRHNLREQQRHAAIPALPPSIILPMSAEAVRMEEVTSLAKASRRGCIRRLQRTSRGPSLK